MKAIQYGLGLLAATAFLTPAAQAQVTLTLLSRVISVAQGGIGRVQATILNNGDAVELGSLSFAGDAFLLDVNNRDDQPFFDNFAGTLNAGESKTGELFDVLIPLNATVGAYNADVTILNGAGEAVSLAAPIRVNVTAAASSAPEPMSLSLSGLGLFALAGGQMLRRRIIR